MTYRRFLGPLQSLSPSHRRSLRPLPRSLITGSDPADQEPGARPRVVGLVQCQARLPLRPIHLHALAEGYPSCDALPSPRFSVGSGGIYPSGCDPQCISGGTDRCHLTIDAVFLHFYLTKRLPVGNRQAPSHLGPLPPAGRVRKAPTGIPPILCARADDKTKRKRRGCAWWELTITTSPGSP
jgi:hypothetical protein